MSIKNITTLADTKYLKLYDASYINKNGESKNWSIASRKDINTLKSIYFNKADCKIDAVIIIATHIVEDKLVIIKQFRIPLNDYRSKSVV